MGCAGAHPGKLEQAIHPSKSTFAAGSAAFCVPSWNRPGVQEWAEGTWRSRITLG
ncbi:hypothetical protein B0I35DRAFT_446491 [Stachybotrys elegans]|uniref:Uncharacterized protein n=1 Tax=Stachybotrys elegans TaxID=80388 RepID=A0A8K0WJ55_9HYPO|nr:hypothetical protein B0I35DRAFT_446491 [Stachybotrys elegans]